MLFGPPAVGKMTVGRELARLTPYRLFHNHATIEPLLGVFDWGTPPFNRLQNEFRTRVVEEAIKCGMPGLICTVAWALDLDQDAVLVEKMISPVVTAGHPVDFVELWSSQETRLSREGTPLRLAHKSSQRDVAWARRNLLEWDEMYRLSTGPVQPFPFEGRFPFIRVDNDVLAPTVAAAQIVERLSLPRGLSEMRE
jgi:hypothetical protein